MASLPAVSYDFPGVCSKLSPSANRSPQVSLPPAVFVELSPNRGLIGTRMGMGFAVVAFGVLIGSPISGAVLDADGFHGLWGFGGAFPVAAGLIWFLSKMAHGKWRLMAKV